jgi:DNA-binding NarL/FixJ family response regulator
MAPRAYICDENPRMRQLIELRLAGSAEIAGSGETPQDAIDAAAEMDLDVVVLDFRTAVGSLGESIAAIKELRPSVTVVVHTGVPRYLIEDQVEKAGGVYAPKHEPEEFVELMRSVNRAGLEATSPGS